MCIYIVNVYIYICMCIFKCICAYVYVHVYVCVLYVHVCVYVYVYVYVIVYVHAYSTSTVCVCMLDLLPPLATATTYIPPLLLQPPCTNYCYYLHHCTQMACGSRARAQEWQHYSWRGTHGGHHRAPRGACQLQTQWQAPHQVPAARRVRRRQYEHPPVALQLGVEPGLRPSGGLQQLVAAGWPGGALAFALAAGLDGTYCTATILIHIY